jgi:predicted metal-binding membrane protein
MSGGVVAPAVERHRRRAQDGAFLVTIALLFLAGAAGTIYWCGTMAGGMPMPGGWMLSMAWMRMPGQTWPGAGAGFVAVWIVMMIAMMTPPLAAMLTGYRRALRGMGRAGVGVRTALAGAGYFAVWAACGAVAWPPGLALVAAELRWPAAARSVPIAIGIVLLLVGGFQLTPWKARWLGRCRDTSACGLSLSPGAMGAFPDGLRLGWHCVLCSAGLMVVLLVAGMMDLRVVALLAAAIAVERLAPWPVPAARAGGVLALLAGAVVIVRAMGLA